MIAPTRPFILIRHGQTDANRDGVIAGRIEARLTETGRATARALAEWPWPDPIALFASPQQRARQTAELAFPDREPILLEDLRERDWGRFEGRPVSDAPPREETPEGGESWPDMIVRVRAALCIAQDRAHGALPVLVAHSGVVRAARQITGASPHGPSPANSTPYLFAPVPEGWRETMLHKKDNRWIA
ncbi:histidine phosphatase family protein [Thalassovita sp.]|uniref:histidine phosphatase family protein n=1 Tax=Thalassovita sp. TaxID=1979401 RepID=UPI002B26B44A|nr:histidine phosphatase family protein [Thalassovita sp.]